jgi:hypothetical protein
MPEVDATTLEFVQWVARTPRTYAAAMSAWRSSCPRLTVWEDALAAGFVRIDGPDQGPIDMARVLLTPQGETVLASQR